MTLPPVGVVDHHVKEKTVALGLGKRIGAFLLDRVLRSQHEERFVQRVGRAAHGDFVLLHGLQERGLCFGRSAVNLVGQQHLGEDRSPLKHHPAMARAGVFLDDIGAGDVGRHEVGRELDTVKRQIHRLRQRTHH